MLFRLLWTWKVVSEKGLQISRTKIQSVLDFPLPIVSKQLKSFLGTANYLRDFVRDYSTISQPLHQLLTDNNKTRRVVWTPESTAAFHEMKLAISECTTMHFMSDIAPITLHTDASDYGVGGYLFQTVHDIDQPVAFVSSSLNKSSTPLVGESKRSLWNILLLYVLTVTPARSSLYYTNKS